MFKKSFDAFIHPATALPKLKGEANFMKGLVNYIIGGIEVDLQ
jgi:hypothetical protein